MLSTDQIYPSRMMWDEYFVNLLPAIALRSPCLRRRIGAVLVINNRIIGTGYNGPLPGHPHCDSVGCLRSEKGIPSGERLDVCRAVHAERNAIDFAIRTPVGATLYCAYSPCRFCAERIVTANLAKVVYVEEYNDLLAREILEYSGVILEKFGA